MLLLGIGISGFNLNYLVSALMEHCTWLSDRAQTLLFPLICHFRICIASVCVTGTCYCFPAFYVARRSVRTQATTKAQESSHVGCPGLVRLVLSQVGWRDNPNVRQLFPCCCKELFPSRTIDWQICAPKNEGTCSEAKRTRVVCFG